MITPAGGRPGTGRPMIRATASCARRRWKRPRRPRLHILAAAFLLGETAAWVTPAVHNAAMMTVLFLVFGVKLIADRLPVLCPHAHARM